MSSDERKPHSEPGSWTPMPRTLDLEAEEIEPKSAAGAEETPAGKTAAELPEGSSAGDLTGEPATGSADATPGSDGDAAGVTSHDDTAASHDADGAPPDQAATGDAATAPRPASRRWRWLAMAALVLLIAGGTAAYGLIGRGWLPMAASSKTEAQLAAFDRRIATLEDKLAKAAPLRADIDALGARLTLLENSLHSLESKFAAAGPAPMTKEEWDSASARLNDAESAIHELETRPAQGPGEGSAAPSQDLLALTAQVEALAAQLAERQGALEAVQSQMAKLSTSLQEGIGGARAKLAESEHATRVATAQALRTAYERGEPLQPWLDTIEGLVGSNPALDNLKSAGQPPTLATLKAGLAQAEVSILSSSDGAGADDGIVARLLANARALVRVRPDGPLPGSTPGAVLTRIEAALNEGRLDQAQAEWQQLPPAAQQAGRDWAAALQARISADSNLADLLGRLNLPANGS